MPLNEEDEVILGNEANQFLNSRLFESCQEHIESQLAAQRRRASIKDSELHTRLIVAEQIWDSYVKFFETLRDTGKMAEIQLEQKRRLFRH